MKVDELIKLNPNKVRASSDLMGFYLSEYEKIFNKKPSCAGCTFKSDWKKFVKAHKTPTQQKIKTMTTTEKTFKLKDSRVRIMTYWLDKSPQRKYSNKLTEEFAIGYLTHGTKEQLEARKKEFTILPKSLQKAEKVFENVSVPKVSGLVSKFVSEPKKEEVIVEPKKEAKKVAGKPKKRTTKKSK